MTALILALAVLGQDCGPGGCPTTRLMSVEVQTGRGLGSGTIVRATNRRALVLTAAHLLRGMERRQTVIRVRDGQSYGGRFLGRAAGADLAALEIATPRIVYERIQYEHPGFQSGRTWELEIAPRTAGRVIMYGFGGENGRGLRRRSGRLLDALADLEGDATYGFQPELGDSGGGAWSPEGYFAGVLSARDGWSQGTSSQAYIVRPQIIRAFLREECCLLRALGRAMFGARENRTTLIDVQLAQAPPVDAPVSSRIIPPPTPFEADTPPAAVVQERSQQLPARPFAPDLRSVTEPRNGVNLDVNGDPAPVANVVVNVWKNGQGIDPNLRAELDWIRAKLGQGITFAIPQLNGLQKRRTVHLGESIGLEMNAQGNAMDNMPTTAPNQ